MWMKYIVTVDRSSLIDTIDDAYCNKGERWVVWIGVGGLDWGRDGLWQGWFVFG